MTPEKPEKPVKNVRQP